MILTQEGCGSSSFIFNSSFESVATPLGRIVTSDEVGNVAAFLCSDYASGVTGEITYVDAGFNIAAMPINAYE